MEIKDYISPIYNGQDLTKKLSATEKSSLGVDDFLKLLAAQLSNQDMMNPSTDTEFIAQLAQFSSLQAMDSLAKISSINQSTDLIGKTVVVAKYGKDNKLETSTGVVEKVMLFNSTPTIIVNGKEYTYENIMEIIAPVKEESIGQETEKDKGNTVNNEATDSGTVAEDA